MMAYKPPAAGATQVGTNKPSQSAGADDDDNPKVERQDFEITVGFRIVNNSNTHVNVSLGGVNPDGTPKWTVLKHLEPGEFMDFTSSVEMLKVEMEPGE